MSDTANEPGVEPAEDVEIPDEVVQTGTEPESEPESEPETEPAPESPAAAGETPLTLDELVADLAESEAGEGAPSQAVMVEEPPATDVEEVEEAAEEAVEGDAEPALPRPLVRQFWTRAPFWAVDSAWAILTLAATIALWRAPAATFADGIAYAILVLGGAALAFVGLVTGLVIWLVARSRAEEDERVGLGLAIWTRALSWTAAGVALWWIGLLLLDLHHAGVIG
jgi:hypothetical protein